MSPRQLAFGIEEYRQRLAKVQQAMQAREVHGLLVHTPENICYLTGYQTSGYFAYQVLFVPSTGEPLLLMRQMEQANADEYSWLTRDRRASYIDIEDPLDATSTILSREGWTDKRVGIEKDSWFFTIRQFERLSRLLPHVTWVDCAGLVDEVRLVKSSAEIEYIRKAAQIVGIGMRAALESLAVGKTENEVAAAIHEAEIRHGCEYTSMPHYLASGHRRRLGHPNWSDKRIERGDQVFLELSGCVKRYSAALMRTVVMGDAPADIQRTAALLLQFQDEALGLMRPGSPAGDVDAACRQQVLKAGLRETYFNRTGYSIGIGFPPRWGEWATRDFMAGSTWTLQAGMVFHFFLGAKGVAFSETVLVTETGHELLTRFDRGLLAR